MTELSHIDSQGNAKMVDVGDKKDQVRMAKAFGRINMSKSTIEIVKSNQIKKGDVLNVARIAGIQGAKQTSNLIPLCHPLQIHNIDVDLEINDDNISVYTSVKSTGKTGVEMEALTAVNIALLTIYDMCKAVDKNMSFSDIHLMEKTKHD